MSDRYGNLDRAATDKSSDARSFHDGNIGGKGEKSRSHGSSARSVASRHAFKTSSPYLSRADEKKKVRTNTSPNGPVRDDEGRCPSPGSTRDTRTIGTASKECIPTPRFSRPSGSSSSHSLHASHVHGCTHTGSDKSKSHSERTSNRPTGDDDGRDVRSVASRPTTSCDSSQCAAPRAEERAYCETVVSRPSQGCFEEDIMCDGCWGGCDECCQPQAWPRDSRSPPPGWGCARGSNCGDCDFCRACGGSESVQGAGYEQEVWDDDLKSTGYALTAQGAPSVVWGWGDRGDDYVEDLGGSARDPGKSKTGSRGNYQRASTPSAEADDAADIRVHILEQDRNNRKTRYGHAVMDARTRDPDNISQANVEDYLRHFEHKISARLDQLERYARAIPPAARNDQGMSAADFELRDLSKQVLKMSAQQKFQREQGLLDRLTKIEEKLPAPTTQHTTKSQAQETLELRELLMKQKWELHGLRKEVGLLSELRGEVVNLDEEVMWMRDRINFLEDLACQRERTGQADITGPTGYASRARDGSIGHAGLMPPSHRPFPSWRAPEGVAGVSERIAGGGWGDGVPFRWNSVPPPPAPSVSHGEWQQVPRHSNQSEFSFRQHGWDQGSQPSGAGWGSPVFSHGDLDRSNTQVPPDGTFWGEPARAQSWRTQAKSPSVSNADFFNRAQRATYDGMGWGRPGEPSSETVSMHSPSRGRCLWSQNRWNESPVGLNDPDAASPSTPRTRRCPTVETISDSDIVSGPSSLGRDWNRITSRHVAGNEIVPITSASRKAPRTLQSQKSDDSWDNISTVNHPPRPATSSKPRSGMTLSSRSDKSGLERGRFGCRRGAPPRSWGNSSGGGGSGDRAGRVYSGKGGDAGGWGGGGDEWGDHSGAVGDNAASACGWD